MLSIAGSDSGGGAGIQADLKAFARAGVHGLTAITALTAQNTLGVSSTESVAREMVIDQVRSVASDIGVDAVKIGMLGTQETIDAVLEALELVGDAPVVVDPVMVAEAGAVLLDPEAKGALIERLLPRATVATPNLFEARELIGAGDDVGQEDLARRVQALGPAAVVVTGGHSGGGDDVLVQHGAEPVRIAGPTFANEAAHGSGCTHSSTLAAMLAWGESVADAARVARAIAAEAVDRGLAGIGAGAGPVDVLGLAGARPEA